ncbi:DUF1877 family protein [Actinoplanes subglobosus]|uniref:DUF1877 family protein n=1 Tax=Actinoplanes subglobosus TaxID=1547892 RepID=A0ABV8IIF2_9ACTN
MGLDFECLAVPLDADPVRAIRASPELWAMADDQPPFSGPWPDEELPDITRRLLAVLPEGTSRNLDFFGSRNHEQAEYLLDPVASRTTQTWEQRRHLPTYQAVFGAELFAEHAASGQGIRWRCSTPDQLAAAVQLIDALDVAAVRREFSLAEMVRLGVYKVHPEEDEQDYFTRNLQDLRTWADHCRHVATQNLGLMITLF